MSDFVFMQGNEAAARGALAAGVRFFAGYPITPSSEVAEIMARELPKLGGSFIQMEDEIASMGAIIGASLTGSKSMTATSGPGFSLKQENLGYAIITETPCVIVNVQRGGPSTGLPTKTSQSDIMQARWGTHGDHPIIAIYPSTVRDVYHEIIRAVGLSERFRIPVIFLMDETLGHMRESFSLPKQYRITDRERTSVDPSKAIFHPYLQNDNGTLPMSDFGDGHRFHVSGLIHDESGFPVTNAPEVAEKMIKRIHSKIYDYVNEIWLNKEYAMEDAEYVVVACGSTARSAKDAVIRARKIGLKVGLFQPITIWPFPYPRLKEISRCDHVKAFIVPEMNMGQMAGEVARCTVERTRLYPLNRVDGELITPEQILNLVKEVDHHENRY
ncbi:MAG: 2-oxoglutarate synthase subunit alpha [Candidatus Wallbacteria bacterium HGW-Wallbacteria-1]|jgi:2-oxoglutarate ferredoxin oxidoreductase subunit alpha|uniref:2-oxoglutarate synthase subunit alpha n=1 Tax=Candidatus Wallbacteria bacterium HGW-Wallbacteria-1 TaxID=2013854 RepID=A0A2N1PIJ4_9BACT|nr:MAG: 2-oxoglutarate synthase subunit alpha [Candidatus Wallbacteria bacterium HGW-Wallbacteria-1]